MTPASNHCQRWRDRRHSWRHTSEGGFDRIRFEVAPIVDDNTAKRFVQAHHYAGTYPSARLRYGLYRGAGDLAGVAVLSVPVRPEVLTGPFPFLQPYAESLELGRFVLLDDVAANAESWFLARVWELAAATGLRGVVSFSDPEPRTTADGRQTFPGHVGTIYQATNALYAGRSRPDRLQLLPDGTVLNRRTLSKIRSQHLGWHYAEGHLVAHGARPRRSFEEPGAWLAEVLPGVTRPMRHGGNHRYLFAIGTRRERQATLRAIGLPVDRRYPKAGGSTCN